MTNTICAGLLCALLALPALRVSAADQWHFKLKNATESRIVKLQVCEDKKEWGDFDVGRGIAVRKTETMVWDVSTDNEDRKQRIRVKFSDATYSEPSKRNVCKGLHRPIGISEE
ncbi:MAG: hypothetical protein ABIW82_01275 [Dokdonella sp.]